MKRNQHILPQIKNWYSNVQWLLPLHLENLTKKYGKKTVLLRIKKLINSFRVSEPLLQKCKKSRKKKEKYEFFAQARMQPNFLEYFEVVKAGAPTARQQTDLVSCLRVFCTSYSFNSC